MSKHNFANDQGELSPKKRALFELLLAEKRKSKKPRAATVIPVRPDDGSAPLSFAQQRMWFLDRLEPESASYNLAFPVRLRGQLDTGALEASLNEMVSRHAILRTNFKLVADQPVQFISAHRPLALPVWDLRNLPVEQQYTKADQLAEQQTRQPFDLTADPLLRAALLLLGEQEQRGADQRIRHQIKRLPRLLFGQLVGPCVLFLDGKVSQIPDG